MSNVESLTSAILSPKDCEEILIKSVGPSAKLITYQVGKLSDKVVGFLGDHFRLIIKYETNNEQRACSYFLKTLPKFNENQLQYVNDMGVFKKECLVYENLLVEFLKLTETPFASQYYYTKPYECLILEDLELKGFKNLNKGEYLSVKQITLLVKTIARFHASTIIYEEKKGGNYRLSDQFTEELTESTFSYVEGHPRQKWCVNVTKCLQDCIKQLVPGVKNPQDICEKIHEFVFREAPKLLKPSRKFRNVLNHDDLWCNNMMFNENDCILVDFQVVHYTPPALDFLTAIYINLEENCVKENFSNLINIYYDTFTEELKRHSLDASKLLSRKEFLESLEAYKCMSLVETCMFATNVYISNELSDIIVGDEKNFNEFFYHDRSSYIMKEYQENAYFRSKFMNVLVPLIETLEKI